MGIKNFKDNYSSVNPAIALEQRWFAKQELTRGEMIAPTDTDFLFTLGGGSISYAQNFDSSPHRSGRSHAGIIKKKKECSFSFSTYFNIDSTKVSAGTNEIDPAVRTLFKSLLGAEDTSSGLKYTPAIPNLTMTIFENGDKWARQSRGMFVQSATLNFPGDGEATVEWSGNGKDAVLIGIGKSESTNAGGQTVTLVSGDGDKFKAAIGGMVMVVKSDGTTRSTDTPNGSPRKIVSVVADVVTLDGAALTADSDGAALTPVYLTYYEPTLVTVTAINDPHTGLQGSFAIDGFSPICLRSMSLAISNDSELVNYCYGEDSLAGAFFVPGSRLNIVPTVESNLTDELIKLFQDVQSFNGQDITVVLGPAAGRRLEINMPKVMFKVPAYAVPDAGSIPVSFEGQALQTAAGGAADEIYVHFK
jgi:hypothetical protein